MQSEILCTCSEARFPITAPYAPERNPGTENIDLGIDPWHKWTLVVYLGGYLRRFSRVVKFTHHTSSCITVPGLLADSEGCPTLFSAYYRGVAWVPMEVETLSKNLALVDLVLLLWKKRQHDFHERSFSYQVRMLMYIVIQKVEQKTECACWHLPGNKDVTGTESEDQDNATLPNLCVLFCLFNSLVHFNFVAMFSSELAIPSSNINFSISTSQYYNFLLQEW